MVVTGEFRHPCLAGGLIEEAHLDGALRAVDLVFSNPGQLGQECSLIHLTEFQEIISFHRCCFLNHDFQIRLKSK